jgi:GTP cyclohydrolase IA
MNYVPLSNNDVMLRCSQMVERHKIGANPCIYGIPRGGIPVAYMLAGMCTGASIVDNPEDASIFVDDIIASGATRNKYKKDYPETPFCALIEDPYPGAWYIFPWEGNAVGSADDIPMRFLQYIGEDPTRDGLKETPQRVVKTWEKLYGGYSINPADLLKTFDNCNCSEMILLKDIEFYSTCEHHLLPFFGKAHIAYIPNVGGKVIGVSKLARLLECFARRLQIQERISAQIADFLMEHLAPMGAAVCLEAQHFCMTSRGVEKQDSIMVTSALRGIFRDKPDARAEFYSLIK